MTLSRSQGRGTPRDPDSAMTPSKMLMLGSRVKVMLEVNLINNVTTNIYNEKIPVPSVSTGMMRALFYTSDGKRLVNQCFISDRRTTEERKEYLTGYVKVLPGEYKLLCYNFDTETTKIKNEGSFYDITAYTRASIFEHIGKQTPCFVRFSTVAGERGAADAERDIRGFAMKFYTDTGNWDLVGNNTPVFFLRDPLKFPDLNHAIKRDPRTNMRSANNNWDFWTLLPEALHQVTITMSPRGIPYSYRHMHGFGSHTYSFINAANERTWVKFHLRTLQGIKNLTDAEAEAIIAKDRESHQRDLFESIERGDYPRWLFQIQLMTQEQARTYRINPFDLTKVWPHGDFPLHDVGILELNRNPENYFAEVEQSAFNPQNIIDGIGFSPDKMLQGRLFSYGDAQRYRLGVNLHQIPVNRPRCPVHSYHRDGAMRVDGNYGSTLGYEPNSYGEWKDNPSLKEPPLRVYNSSGVVSAARGGASASGPHGSGNPGYPTAGVDIYNYPEREYDDDYYSQPGDLFRLMPPEEKIRYDVDYIKRRSFSLDIKIIFKTIETVLTRRYTSI